MDQFLQPVQVALSHYLTDWHQSLIPLTKAMDEFSRRQTMDAMGWASGRLVDDVSNMLSQWQEDVANDRTPDTRLPAVIIAMDPSMEPTGRDFVRQQSEWQYVRLSDEDERVFQVSATQIDVRVQLAIAAHDVTTAKALAAQLSRQMEERRRFNAVYEFAGHELPWPVLIETPESPASRVDHEYKNLTLLAFDLMLKATLPIYRAPGEGEPNDGSELVPAGYPVVLSEEKE